MNKPKLSLIDADYAPYAFGNYTEVEAIVETDKWLLRVNERTTPDYTIICLSGDGNYRNQVSKYKPYKGNRRGKEKPKYYDMIKDKLKAKANAFTINGAEADDLISMLYYVYKDRYDITVVSDDKDLLIIPCNHFRHSTNIMVESSDRIDLKMKTRMNVLTDMPEFVEYKEYYGAFKLYQQMLIGDSTDNIQGIPGIGESNNIFATLFKPGITVTQARKIVWDEYVKYYKEDAVDAYLEMYRLLSPMKYNNNV